jgi:hypothetical protein
MFVFWFLLAGCGDGGGNGSNDDINTPLNYYSVSIPTAVEEAEQFVYVLSQYKWFQDMGYTHVTLPSHPVINPLKEKVLNGGSLTSAEITNAKSAFINDLYNAADYQKAFAEIRSAAVTADKQIDSLRRYETAWDFFIPERYTIQLTVYGPGGSYNPSTGLISILVPKNGRFDRKPLWTILHESVHIGIEKRIIEKYKLQQWVKERIVDQFVKKHFSSVVPDYQMQNINLPAVDKMFQNSDVLDKLPQRVEEMLAAMKQEGIDKAGSVATNSTPTALEGYWVNVMSSETAYIFKGNGFVEIGNGSIYNFGTFTYVPGTITYTPSAGSGVSSTWTQPYELKDDTLELDMIANHNFGQFKKE